MYGCGVLLIRDLVRSRKLGWVNIGLLAAAYGLAEEGLIITSIYNPNWGGVLPLGKAGWFLGINWIWAFYSAFVHIVLTVFSSIVLAESLFPQIADKPWLNAKHRALCTLLFLASGVFGFNLFVNTLYPAYSPPLLSYLLTLAVTAFLIIFALKLKHPTLLDKQALNNHQLAFFMFGLFTMTFSIIVPYALAKAALSGWVILLIQLIIVCTSGLIGFALIKKYRGWSLADRLALTSGIITPWLLRMVLLELGIMRGVRKMNMHGMTIAAVIVIALLWRGYKNVALKN